VLLGLSLTLLGCGLTSRNGHTPQPAATGGSAAATAGTSGSAGAPIGNEPETTAPQCAVAIAGSDGRQCAIYKDHSVWCWGSSFGKAPGNFQESSEPLQVADVYGDRLWVGPRHSCVIDGRQQTWCWGDNESGQIDDSGKSPLPPTLAPLTPLAIPKGMGLSDKQSCSTDATSNVYCRGTDDDGQRSTLQNIAIPSDITLQPTANLPGNDTNVLDARGLVFSAASWKSPQVLSVFGSDNQRVLTGGPSCALKRWGSLWCTDYRVDVSGLPLHAIATLGEDVQDAGVGDLFLCALTKAGKVWCEGFNQQGQTATGADTTFEAGHYVEGLGEVRALSVNHSSACAITTDSAVWCWGVIGPGRLVNVPTQVSGCDAGAPTTPTAPVVQRYSAERAYEAGAAYAQAVCACAEDPSDEASCVDAENPMPNGACMAALAPDEPMRHECRARNLWATASCYAGLGCPLNSAGCSQAGECPEPAATKLERYCRRHACAADPTQELLVTQLCDGIQQCQDGSDERNCTAGAATFDCGQGNGDIPISIDLVCDDKLDCPNGSDELGCQ
jgi:hypothetical protein